MKEIEVLYAAYLIGPASPQEIGELFGEDEPPWNVVLKVWRMGYLERRQRPHSNEFEYRIQWNAERVDRLNPEALDGE